MSTKQTNSNLWGVKHRGEVESLGLATRRVFERKIDGGCSHFELHFSAFSQIPTCVSWTKEATKIFYSSAYTLLLSSKNIYNKKEIHPQK